MIQGAAEPGEGSYGNLLGALGARWAFAFMRGGFGVAAPLFGLWGVAAGGVAVWRRTPFVVVVILAMAVTAFVRWQTWI